MYMYYAPYLYLNPSYCTIIHIKPPLYLPMLSPIHPLLAFLSMCYTPYTHLSIYVLYPPTYPSIIPIHLLYLSIYYTHPSIIPIHLLYLPIYLLYLSISDLSIYTPILCRRWYALRDCLVDLQTFDLMAHTGMYSVYCMYRYV
jgi:hypothetical protein